VTMTWEAAYVAAGLVLAGYYLPQVRLCLVDRSGLHAYSLPKALIQLAMRALMMPFVFASVDSTAMLAIQALDLALRGAEVASAVWSLRRQGWAWGGIGRRATYGTGQNHLAGSTTSEGGPHGSTA
jgi:hypothetical protein